MKSIEFGRVVDTKSRACGCTPGRVRISRAWTKIFVVIAVATKKILGRWRLREKVKTERSRRLVCWSRRRIQQKIIVAAGQRLADISFDGKISSERPGR